MKVLGGMNINTHFKCRNSSARIALVCVRAGGSPDDGAESQIQTEWFLAAAVCEWMSRPVVISGRQYGK